MRSRVRDRKGKIALFAADWKFRTVGRQILRWVSDEQAFELVDAGKATPLRDADSDVVGLRLLRACERPSTGAQPKPYQERMPVAEQSNTAFSRPEVHAIAGEHFPGGENRAGQYGPPGRSRTARLNEEQRMSRIAKGLCEVDLVEAARAKLNLYTSVH